MGYRIEPLDDKGVITLSGELTIRQAGEIKEALVKAIDVYDKIILNIENVTEIDFTFLQLLCSGHRTVIKLNKSLCLNNPRPAIFGETADNTGFTRHTGCILDGKKNCLWTGGKND